MAMRGPKEILLVTGMSGAGKSTALRTLEDMGWEIVDQLPLLLLDRLLATRLPQGAADDHAPLAIGIGTRTRGFDALSIVERIRKLRDDHDHHIGVLFLDCSGGELERRFSETRRRHPLASDRPVGDGIVRERELLAPLRATADRLIDTSRFSTNDLQHLVRKTFATARHGETVLSVQSFGFARGLPAGVDLVFDMRFLRNPHWQTELRPGTGRDQDVADYIAADPAYDSALQQIESLLLTLLPRYQAEGKSYVAVAFGCTGGRHRSVHVAERVAARLREEGFFPTLTHRDLGTAPTDSLEGAPTV
ncbi:RNase adapter RapZ [Stakelama saccharophila]|uniref:RNase adapter RapZ n=1 Tax=Stakelama saccharophila TaxID=3075605 RepID=A0ABZ0B582_9SPHN|nr:RNase adapter RapZ [Stakelama sp. W311]WNO52489.1 RNase adapter RapZ [Stakelama sp. W311]